MATKLERFRNTLSQLFMLDHAELDFGIYRIMNCKREEINKFLNTILPQQVKEVLTSNVSADTVKKQNQLNEIIKQVQSLGYDPETNSKVLELRKEIAQTGNIDEMENTVYSHLSTFFGRYYDNGDFISLRRYKKDVYAIPYEGEEVKLHWANADQYYIKTGEYFQTYSFKLGNNKRVEFTLKEADTEQNNNLAQNNMERRFALYNEEPINVECDTLHINFTYQLYPKTTKQKSLIESAFNTVKEIIPGEYNEVFALRPTEKDRSRTLLQKHLNDYVARNTFDYFIHKDLKGFLTRELDFYIKNEILFIDDINARATTEFVSQLSVIKAIKAVGLTIIKFLSQIEEFQKHLWLKKKFVVAADYCITLDRISETLYPEICTNEAQRKEWVKLFAINEIKTKGDKQSAYSEPLTVEFLKQNQNLVLDTAFFSEDFKKRLISSIDNLDEQCDGLLINSENFQALQLLKNTKKESIKCLYFDPPYNTSEASLLYKNSYKHSSWLSMIANRFAEAYTMLEEGGVLMVTIDDEELYNLKLSLDTIIGKENYIGTIVIQSNPRGRSINSFYATCHEYCLCYAKYPESVEIINNTLTEEQTAAFSVNEEGEEAYRYLPFRRSGGWSEPQDRPNSEFPLFFEDGKLIAVGGERKTLPPDEYTTDEIIVSDPASNDIIAISVEDFNREHPDALRIMPIDTNGKRRVWRWSDRKKILSAGKNGDFALKNNGSFYVQLKDRIKSGRKPKTMWMESKYDSSSHGTNLLKSMFNKRSLFGFPKSVYSTQDTIHTVVGEDTNSTIIDIFAGSGTTGHAVINLNRNDEENGKRKYVLVEMGTYFDTVTKPRIQKVIYSEDWSNGKPISRKGISNCFKYMRLEQYEDTLNNLTLSQNTIKNSGEFYDGFLLNYMLDIEARGSLFNMQWFVNPFNMKMNITRNNETTEERINLIETFNYLIGLKVNNISYPTQDICTVTGRTHSGKNILIIWRDCTKVDNKQLNDFFNHSAHNINCNKFDTIYVNGDNNLENLRTENASWKVMLIEQEFNKQMFNT